MDSTTHCRQHASMFDVSHMCGLTLKVGNSAHYNENSLCLPVSSQCLTRQTQLQKKEQSFSSEHIETLESPVAIGKQDAELVQESDLHEFVETDVNICIMYVYVALASLA